MMTEYTSFKELFDDVKKTDSFWTEKAILDFTTDLNKLMNQKGVSRKEFAEVIGHKQAYITKVLRGNANFTIRSMVKLVRALGGTLNIKVSTEKIEEDKQYSTSYVVPQIVESWTKREKDYLKSGQVFSNQAAIVKQQVYETPNRVSP